jgi:diadenosine tetraphosphate (Ap4A) HIT family hydrolase
MRRGMPKRQTFDVTSYVAAMKARPCFICGLVSGNPDFTHHVVYEDDFAVAFLNKFPPLLGYVLVCPKAHLEQIIGDFSRETYLRLQALIYDIGQALRTCLEIERIYVLSLGSQDGNPHVHWHLAPMPPGVPFEDQQFAALDAERAGVLVLDEAELQALAARIRAAIKHERSEVLGVS